jgi:hypothetical protein
MAANATDYGYASLAKLATQRVTAVAPALLMDALRERSAAYSAATAEMLSTLAVRTTNAQERYALPGSGTLQPLDALGIPLPVIPSGYTSVAYPVYGGGTAAGRDRISAILETVQDVQRDQEDAESRDADWLKRQVLASLLTPTTRTFVDDVAGSLTVQPLALTSDGVVYVRNNGSSSTAQHYLAQTAAIADATNPYPTLATLLGAYPSNVGRPIIVYVPTVNVATTIALATFYPVADPDVAPGSATDRLVGSGASLRHMGDRVLGKVGTVWVVEWSSLPDNTLLAVVDGRPPLAMREYPDARLQGFFPEFHSPDGARLERRYLRYCGFGVRNRIAAAAYQVSNGDTTFDAVAAFTAPLAV